MSGGARPGRTCHRACRAGQAFPARAGGAGGPSPACPSRTLAGRTEGVLAIAIGSATVAWVARALVSSPAFEVRHLVVRGNSRLATSDVTRLLEG